MKDYVPFLDTNAMPWSEGEFPGLFTKLLSSNAKTGARTALQCIDPARGYKPPTVAHYHPDMDEELYVLKGRMSFDSQNWLGAGSYCFHPGNTVHGFKSKVTEESWFLSRISCPLEFGFVEQPKQFQPYSLTGTPADRPINVLADPLHEPGWVEEKNDKGDVVLRRYSLGRHPRSGEGSELLEFTSRWTARHGAHFHTVYRELFVVRGAFTTADGTVFRAGCYSFAPPYTVLQPIVSAQDALVYVNFGGPLDFVPAEKLPKLKQAS